MCIYICIYIYIREIGIICRMCIYIHTDRRYITRYRWTEFKTHLVICHENRIITKKYEDMRNTEFNEL